MTGNELNGELAEDVENLTLSTQIVLGNQEQLEEALEDGDEIERQRWLQNYLASVNTLCRHAYRVGEDIDRETAERCRGQLGDLLDEE